MLFSLRLFVACVPVFVPRHVLLGSVFLHSQFFLVFSFACPLLSSSHTGFVIFVSYPPTTVSAFGPQIVAAVTIFALQFSFSL